MNILVVARDIPSDESLELGVFASVQLTYRVLRSDDDLIIATMVDREEGVMWEAQGIFTSRR